MQKLRLKLKFEEYTINLLYELRVMTPTIQNQSFLRKRSLGGWLSYKKGRDLIRIKIMKNVLYLYDHSVKLLYLTISANSLDRPDHKAISHKNTKGMDAWASKEE
jgi:hypothetical protein